ncbi:hypothetical protein AAGG74_17855 [Bacillus mexicanus]|uniref:hypothetical protein n=1 Tax=Bacillus mexicanus TaxID=2834415 RepID=UPI003D20AC91
MTIIAENEIEFKNFLNDGYETGVFKLKLKKLGENREKKKVSMLVYKRKTKNNVFTLYKKSDNNHKSEFAVYKKENNTLFTEDANQFISFRINFSEKNETSHKTIIHSPKKEQHIVSRKQPVAVKPVKNEVSKNPECTVQPSNQMLDRIKEVLSNELKNAKKVWAILNNGEELQLDNNVFEESKVTYLGNTKNYVKLLDIQQLKFRKKLYL